MKKIGTTFIAIVAFLAAITPVFAQNVGDRVRVTTGGGTVVGRVVSISGDGFDVGLGGARSGSFARDEILRLERSLGTQSAWKRGLLFGGAGGALAGFTVARTLIYATCDVVTLGTATEECSNDGFGVALASGAIWGGVGALLGLGVGALIRGPERWEVMATDDADIFTPIVDFRLDRGRPAAVLGASLRL